MIGDGHVSRKIAAKYNPILKMGTDSGRGAIFLVPNRNLNEQGEANAMFASTSNRLLRFRFARDAILKRLEIDVTAAAAWLN